MSHIPVWVYILFFVLLYIGIKRCFTRVSSVRWLIIVPVIFIFFNFRGIFALFPLAGANIFYWIVGMFLGILLGYAQMRNCLIKADRKKQLIQIPGDNTMLVLIMAIFFLEFFVHFAIAAHFAIVEFPIFHIIFIAASGIMVGYFTGRSGTYFYKYFQVVPCDLKKKL